MWILNLDKCMKNIMLVHVNSLRSFVKIVTRMAKKCLLLWI